MAPASKAADHTGEVTANSCHKPSKNSKPLKKNMPTTSARFSKIIQSPHDLKKYRAIELRNGLKALLIENIPHDVDDAAVAMTVGVGSYCDPDDAQGLAHLLEHALFLGSKAYPKESSFDAFLDRRGGSSNASTDLEETTFQFEVYETSLKPAMKRFADMFVNPLLYAGRISKELKVVDSEFNESRQNDYIKMIQVLKTFVRKEHPMSKLNFGNLESLLEVQSVSGIDIQEYLREFFKKYYCASNMCLVVQAGIRIKKLEKWVSEIFIKIPETGTVVPPDFSQDFYRFPFDDVLFCGSYKMASSETVYQLKVTWTLPPTRQKWQKKSFEFVTWILTHDGHGSLIQYLKQRLWGLQIYQGLGGLNFDDNSASRLMILNFDLTFDGHRHVLAVLTAIFFYINMLRNSLDCELKRLYEERKLMSEALFTWQEYTYAIENTEELSKNMMRFPMQNILTGNLVMQGFNADSIRGILEMLNPSQVNIVWASSGFLNECTVTEKWFDVRFMPWCDENLVEWKKAAENHWQNRTSIKEFQLPTPNKYIVTDFKIIVADVEKKLRKRNHLVRLRDNKWAKLWWKLDDKFQLPRTCAYFSITSELGATYKDKIMLELFVQLLQINLSAEIFEAETCDLNTFLMEEDGRLYIEIEGFSHKLPSLLFTIVDHLIDFQVNEALFDSVKTDMRKERRNLAHDPKTLGDDLMATILNCDAVTLIEDMKIFKDVTNDDIMDFVKRFLSSFFVEGLIYGNTNKEHSLEMIDYFHKRLRQSPLHRSGAEPFRVLQLPLGSSFCRVQNIKYDDLNSYVINYYQIGIETIRRKLMAEIVVSLMEEPLYRILRTQEQLGYNVSCNKDQSSNVFAICIKVHHQAHKFSTFYVNQRIEFFLKSLITTLQNMKTNTFFSNTVLPAIGSRLGMCQQMGGAAYMIWNEIKIGKYNFDRNMQEVTILLTIKKKEVIEFAKKIFLSPKQYRNPRRVIQSSNNQKQRKIFLKLPHQTTITEKLQQARTQLKILRQDNMNNSSSSPNHRSKKIFLSTKQSRNPKRVIRSSNNHKQYKTKSSSSPNHKSKAEEMAEAEMAEIEELAEAEEMAGNDLTKRKLSIHILGHGSCEKICLNENMTTNSTGHGASAEQKQPLALNLINSQPLYPKSQHILDIKRFKETLYQFPVS